MGPAICYSPGAISMKENWVQGAPLILHTQLHSLLNPIPRRRLRIALYNRLCARSIITHRRGMGYKIPPWGKGLKEKSRPPSFLASLHMYSILHLPHQDKTTEFRSTVPPKCFYFPGGGKFLSFRRNLLDLRLCLL